jgi:hypothetical protein
VAAEIVLRIEESGLARDPADSHEQASTQLRRTRVTVAPSLVMYEQEPGSLVVLDLDRRRRLKVDPLARTYSDDSLFTVVAGRHVELPNRAHIRQVLDAGGAPVTEFTPLWVEHQLAIKDPSIKTIIGGGAADGNPPKKGWRSFFKATRPEIDVRTVGAQVICTAGGRPLVSHSCEGPRELGAVRGYVQFIRYRYGGHPLVLEHLAALEFIPREVTLHALAPPGLGVRDVSLRVEECHAGGADRPDTLDLQELTPFSEQPDDEVIRASRTAARRSRSEPVEAQVASSLRALQSGDPLEGLLSFLELTLESDLAMPQAVTEALKSTPDSGVKTLITALGYGRSTAIAEAVDFSLRAYAELALAAKSKVHILWTFEAGLRACRGETAEAKRLLTRAIAANPRLAAAYKDLGDLFLRDFDARRAWACWETARDLAPTHPVLRSVAAFEETLRTGHPEYFAD